MTTRELYFQAYMVSDKSEGMLYYTILIDGKECLKATPWLLMDKDSHEDNIEIMQIIEKQQGFMFWNLSPECEIWLAGKSKRLKTIISGLCFTQR